MKAETDLHLLAEHPPRDDPWVGWSTKLKSRVCTVTGSSWDLWQSRVSMCRMERCRRNLVMKLRRIELADCYSGALSVNSKASSQCPTGFSSSSTPLFFSWLVVADLRLSVSRAHLPFDLVHLVPPP